MNKSVIIVLPFLGEGGGVSNDHLFIEVNKSSNSIDKSQDYSDKFSVEKRISLFILKIT